MFTLHCSNKAIAIKAMLAKWNEYAKEHYQEYGPVQFTEETVKESRVFFCKSCEYYSVGDNQCCACGKDFASNGRTTFIIQF